MIEAIEGKGVNRANAVCDDCGRIETVTCSYTRAATGDWSPNVGQIKKKITAHGWSVIKGAIRCPSCEAKRKVVNMADVKKLKTESKAENRQPTRDEKRKIMDMLGEVYDTENEQYLQGDTDDTVAEVLGVMPGWVANLRDEFFGPAGGNENMEDFEKRISEMAESLTSILESASQQHEAATKKMAEVSAMRADFERIKTAVGARTLKKAGVK